MAVLSNVWLSTEKLEKLINGLKAKKLKGIGVTVAINDEATDYGKNVSIYIPKSKDKPDSKNFYLGNGRCNYHDGKLSLIKIEDGDNILYRYNVIADTQDVEPQNTQEDEIDDLPF